MIGRAWYYMNNVYLCVGKYAKNPFYVKFSDISVYSMEELCYYFIENIYNIDYDIAGQPLVNWIRNECGMTKLADELDVYVRKKMSVAIFVTTILENVGLYDTESIKKAERILKEQAQMTPYEREKKRAEYYYQSGRFKEALKLYAELLEQTPDEEVGKRAVLYYDMASVYAMDFDYEQAAKFYYQSYSLQLSRRARMSYILANRMSMSDFDYGVFMREHEEWKQYFEEADNLIMRANQAWDESKEKKKFKELIQYKDNGQTNEYYKKTGELLKSLKEDYRRQVT